MAANYRTQPAQKNSIFSVEITATVRMSLEADTAEEAQAFARQIFQHESDNWVKARTEKMGIPFAVKLQ